MFQVLTLFVFTFLWQLANGLGGVKMTCPGNQEYVYNAEVCMPTCGRPDPWNTVVTAYGSIYTSIDDGYYSWCPGRIYGGCRCPVDKPFLMDDGIMCTDSCPDNSTRLCPGNQIVDYVFDEVETCITRSVETTDFTQHGCACYGGILDIDGYTCVASRECPPICKNNQWLNLVDGKPCTKTCEHRNPPCDDFVAPRCECPEEAPYLSTDGVTCLTDAECDEPITDTTLPPTPSDFCHGVVSDTDGGTESNIVISIIEGPNSGRDATKAFAQSGKVLVLSGNGDKLQLESDCSTAETALLSITMWVKNVDDVVWSMFNADGDLIHTEEFGRINGDTSQFSQVQIIPGETMYDYSSFGYWYEFYNGLLNPSRVEIEFVTANNKFRVKDLSTAWCCGGVMSTTDCPGNQVFGVEGASASDLHMEWPNSMCTSTCDDPYPVTGFWFSCDSAIFVCACPRSEPFLQHFDGINCVQEKQCPLTSCLGNQVWTPEGKPCDYTCDVDESQTPCSNFDAYRCECPDGTYLSAVDGITCTDCLTDCPDTHSRLDLVYGVDHYNVRVIPANNTVATRALKGSGRGIPLTENQRFRIAQADMFLTRELCFMTINVRKVKINYFGATGRGPDRTVIVEIQNEGDRHVCTINESNAKKVEIRFEAEIAGMTMRLSKVEMKACVPTPA